MENMNFLLKSGLNIDSKDELGRTPLMISGKKIEIIN